MKSDILKMSAIFHLHRESKKQNKQKTKRIINTESKIVVARREGLGEWAKYMKGIKMYKFSVLK